MSLRISIIGVLIASALTAVQPAWAMPPLDLAADGLQAGSLAGQARYELGAVVDVRRASVDGVTVLAITPGGAADRLGLRPGDQLRAINGRRLDDIVKPGSTLESALQQSSGVLRVEAMRNGNPLVLSGRADTVSSTPREGSCGRVSARAGVVPRREYIFVADITQVDGRSTPLYPEYRHKVSVGNHVLVVRDFIDPKRLNSAQIVQIAKMKKFAYARAYKSIVVNVEPGMSYYIGARLLRDKLDTQSIRDNAYWEPVVWKKVAEACP